jgi:hypothetical protein
MNCANHQQTPAAAYCRTCGKPLCTNCTRPVMGVIYCENCVAEKMAGTAPPPIAVPPGYQGPIQPISTGPNPALAGILSIFPGIGAVYSGLYVKGLVHLVIFVLLVVGASNTGGSDALGTIFGILLSAFYIYQIIDAVKSAKAIQAGQPAPDPFGLATMFSPGGERMDFTRGVPTGALVLIGLGVLFLLHNLGIWFLEVDTLWPVLLIGLGLWLLAKRKACNDRGDMRHRSFAGPAVLITVGVLSLLNNLHDRWWGVPGWNRTWPVILLVIGVIKLMERSGHSGGPTFPGPQAGSDVPPQQQPPSEVNSEVNNHG